MLLREHVVLGRSTGFRRPPGGAHVGVGRQGVGGCCLGGHCFCFLRRRWRIYLARRARRRLAILAFLCWLSLKRKG